MPSDDHPTQVPKKKRSREQLDLNSSQEPEAVAESAQKPAQAEPSEEKSTDPKEPEKKRHRDGSQEQDTKSDKVGLCCFFSHSTFQSLTIIRLRVSRGVHSQRLHLLPSPVPTNPHSAPLEHRLRLFSSPPTPRSQVSLLHLGAPALVPLEMGSPGLAVDSERQQRLVVSPASHHPAPPLLLVRPSPSHLVSPSLRRSVPKSPRTRTRRAIRTTARMKTTALSRLRRPMSDSTNRPV